MIASYHSFSETWFLHNSEWKTLIFSSQLNSSLWQTEMFKKKVVFKVGLDVVLFASGKRRWLWFVFKLIQPFVAFMVLQYVDQIFPVTQRGFFCGDLTISLPYKISTVPSSVLAVNFYSVPVIVSHSLKSQNESQDSTHIRCGSSNCLFMATKASRPSKQSHSERWFGSKTTFSGLWRKQFWRWPRKT